MYHEYMNYFKQHHNQPEDNKYKAHKIVRSLENKNFMKKSRNGKIVQVICYICDKSQKKKIPGR